MLVLITGASRGVGLEMVRNFSKNANSLVIAVTRDSKLLERALNDNHRHNVLVVKADIGKRADLLKLKKLIEKLDTPIDILINNAGQLIKKPFEKINEQELVSVYQTNVFAPFHLTQNLLPYFGKGAHIVNISSMGGVQGSSKFAGLSAYSSSKGALAILSECLAEELKPRNISVNCLALGAVQTEMLKAAFPGYKASLTAKQMAQYICDFALNGNRFFNGKILPVSLSTP